MSRPSLWSLCAVLLLAAVPCALDGEDAPAPPPLRLLVFLVDEAGVPRLADALTCPYDTRVNHATGTPRTLDWLRYSFTPHVVADPAHHTSLSF